MQDDPQNDPQTLVSTGWLAERLGRADLRVIDASWHMPAEARNPRAEYEAIHIPGARFFDIDEICDLSSSLPHMAPPVEKFISRIRAMGIGDGQQIVVYDSKGLFSAARVWWLFRLFGKKDCAVLNGGLPKWQAEGRAVEAGAPEWRERHFSAKRIPKLVAYVTDMANASKLGHPQIVDARAAERFAGRTPEPRPGLRSGHIPGARNVCFASLLQKDGTMKNPDEMRRIFEAAGVDLEKPIITSCGSGVTAAILSLALEILGHRDHALYDGSWTEWGAYEGLRVATS